MIMQPNRIYLYGIDPGSGKAWDVYSSCFDVCSKQLVEQPVYTQWGRVDLHRAIQSILAKAKEPSTATMVAIDVPVVTPQDFTPPFVCDDSRHYPFTSSLSQSGHVNVR